VATRKPTHYKISLSKQVQRTILVALNFEIYQENEDLEKCFGINFDYIPYSCEMILSRNVIFELQLIPFHKSKQKFKENEIQE
jgi:hypothetical protein